MEYNKTKGLLSFAYRIGIAYAFWYIIRALCNKIKLKKLYRISGIKLINLMKQFVVHEYGEFINKIQDDYKKGKFICSKKNEKMIWIFWMQGENSMPNLIKINIESVKKNAGCYKVIVLNRQNIDNYITLPKYIFEKLDKGKISPTHFSDILRFNLLYEYGGLWLDATVFISEKIPETCFQKRLFAFNYKHFSHYSQEKWEFFVLGTIPNTLFMYYFSQLLNYYWKKENYAFHYYMADIMMLVAYDKFEDVKQDIDSIKVNPDMFTLYEYILSNKSVFSKETILNIFEKSFVHKFDRRFFLEKHTNLLKQSFEILSCKC
jgi:hypothetical protein